MPDDSVVKMVHPKYYTHSLPLSCFGIAGTKDKLITSLSYPWCDVCPPSNYPVKKTLCFLNLLNFLSILNIPYHRSIESLMF